MSIDDIRRMTRAELEEYILTALAQMPIDKAAKLVTNVAAPVANEEKGEQPCCFHVQAK